jgi:hypothetical protein
MPEYDRVKNKTLDLLDQAQDAITAMEEQLLRVSRGKIERTELLESSSQAAVKLLRLYQWLRPKVRRGGKFSKHYELLGRMELYAWGKKPLQDLAGNEAYMLAAYNRLQEFIEDLKLTKFEKEVIPPWVRLALAMSSRKR